MAEPFIGEIRLFPFAFAPKGWAQCNGQLLPINQNQALFALYGTDFGGDGRNTFALPNLQGRVSMHRGNGFTLGQSGGEAAHTLNIAELPAHSHLLQASPNNGSTVLLANAMLASALNVYRVPDQLKAISTNSLQNAGSSTPHQNMQPFLTLNYCVALIGIFPSQT